MPTPTRRTPARRRAPKKATPPPKPKIVPEDLSDFNESLNILIYGDSGVGKTPLAGGAPKACFISTEKGTISAKRFGSKAKLIRATTWELLEAALDYIDEHPDEFDWIILDSLTKMQVLLIRYILKKQHEDNEARDLDIPAIQDHQKWQNMMKRFVDRIIDMPVNTIFIATAMHREDAEGEDLVMPHVEGKDYAIAQYVCAQMDGVYCLKVKTDSKTGQPFWRLLTKTRPPYFAKDRYNAFESPVVDRPVMTEIIEAIRNSAGEMETSVAADSLDSPTQSKRRSRTRTSAVLQDTGEVLDDEEDAEELDGSEMPAKPVTRRAQARSQAKSPQARKGRLAAVLVEEAVGVAEDWREDEDEAATPPKARRAAATRRPARTRRQPVKPAEDDFDPEDDELDLED